MAEIIVALITGGLTLVGVIITNLTSNKKIEHKIQISQAITDTKVDELTREVRMHNNFAERIPVIEEKIKVMNHRISDLESEEKSCQK